MFFIIFNYKMTTKQLNIKNRSYCFYNDLINVLSFEAANLKLDSKTWKDLDIYFIGYVDKNPEWNVNSVNPLYLMINRFYGHIEEENVKYLIISDISRNTDVLKKYDQVFSGIKHHIRKINNKDSEYDQDYKKIKFLTDDSILLNKMIYFPTVTLIIRFIFEKSGKYYPQVYLD